MIEQITEEQILSSIEMYEKDIEESRILSNLESNPDFRKIFADGLFRDQVAYLALSSNDPRIDPDEKEEIYAQIKGISSLFHYLHSIHLKGDRAKKEVELGREELSEIRGHEKVG